MCDATPNCQLCVLEAQASIDENRDDVVSVVHFCFVVGLWSGFGGWPQHVKAWDVPLCMATLLAQLPCRTVACVCVCVCVCVCFFAFCFLPLQSRECSQEKLLRVASACGLRCQDTDCVAHRYAYIGKHGSVDAHISISVHMFGQRKREREREREMERERGGRERG